jgi:O-antigen/teichoic acid export membrane protein
MNTTNKNSFYRNFTYLLSGNALSQAIPFILAPVIARLFTPEDFAIQGNFTALVCLIAIIGAGRYEFAFVLPKNEQKANTLLLISIRIAFTVGILTLLLIPFKEQLAQWYKSKELANYIPFVSLAFLLFVMFTIFNLWHTRIGAFKTISSSVVLQSIVIGVFSILFGYLDMGAGGLVFAWIIGLSAGVALFIPKMIKNSQLKSVNKADILPTMREYKDFPLVNSMHAFVDLFFSQFLLFAIITREFGLLTLGLFFLMNKYLRAPLKLIGSSIGQIFYKEANDKHLNHESIMEICIKASKIVFVCGIPFLFIVLFFGKSLFSWYLGKEWELSGLYAQIMIFPIFFNLLVSPISSIPLIFNRQKTAFIISLCAYIMSIAGIYIGIYLAYDFIKVLQIFATIMSLYYLVLLAWYYSIIKKEQ